MELNIKVWDKKTKKMRKIHSIAFDDNGNIKLVNMWGKDIIEQKEIVIKRENNYELLPPTGVKDISKKDSYLGDILKEPRPTYGYEPSKDHEKAFYIIKKESDSNNMYLEYNFNIRGYWEKNKLPLWRIENLEIVGSIYTNPDMIKKEV